MAEIINNEKGFKVIKVALKGLIFLLIDTMNLSNGLFIGMRAIEINSSVLLNSLMPYIMR